MPATLSSGFPGLRGRLALADLRIPNLTFEELGQAVQEGQVAFWIDQSEFEELSDRFGQIFGAIRISEVEI